MTNTSHVLERWINSENKDIYKETIDICTYTEEKIKEKIKKR
jgi:hypothetical protein